MHRALQGEVPELREVLYLLVPNSGSRWSAVHGPWPPGVFGAGTVPRILEVGEAFFPYCLVGLLFRLSPENPGATFRLAQPSFYRKENSLQLFTWQGLGFIQFILPNSSVVGCPSTPSALYPHTPVFLGLRPQF